MHRLKNIVVLAGLAILLSACSSSQIRSGDGSGTADIDRPIRSHTPVSPSDGNVDYQPAKAVSYLIDRAQRAEHKADYVSAAATLERAVRITPQDAHLWLYLAQLRLRTGQAQLAESLAVKSISLAGQQRGLLIENWKVITQARDASGDRGGAEVARQKVFELESGKSVAQ